MPAHTSALLLWLALASGLFAAEPSNRTNRVPVEVSVDPRVELISLIFRLAGNPEYNRAAVSGYAGEVEKRFGSNRNHRVIQMARQWRNAHGVSFDAPMSLAIHLTAPPELKARIPLRPRPAGLDGRWPLGELPVFLEQARQFAAETDFQGFSRAQQPLYDLAAKRARELLAEARLEWFDQFFGARPAGKFKLAVALLNGPNNYGARIHVGGREELYCMLGVWRTDGQGDPKFDPTMLGTVTHEFCHSYVNPLVYGHEPELAEAGQTLYSRVRQRMSRMAYGNWTTMIHESVVRAAVVRYLNATRGAEASAQQVKSEVNRGFLWMEELAQLLARYESERQKYPNFEAFFPNVIEFFRESAQK